MVEEPQLFRTEVFSLVWPELWILFRLIHERVSGSEIIEYPNYLVVQIQVRPGMAFVERQGVEQLIKRITNLFEFGQPRPERHGQIGFGNGR